MRHGTLTAYKHCRCQQCRRAMSDYHRQHTPPINIDRAALRDLLLELFPNGLTDQCPARRNTSSSPAS